MLKNLALTLAVLSLLVSFYQKEPPPTDIVMAGAVAVTLVYFLIRREIPKYSWPEYLAIAFMVFNLLQLSTDSSPKAIFWVAVTTFLILAYLTLHSLSRLVSAWYFFRAYIFASIVNLVLMILAFISLYNFGHDFPGMTQFGRSQGLFKDPNVAGPFLIPALIYFVDSSIRQPRPWKFALSGALLIGIFFSLSRGAIIAMVVALLVWLIIKRAEIKKYARHYVLAVANLALFTVIVFSYGPFYNLAQQRFRLVQGYDAASRSSSWQSGVASFTENPSGSGPGSFESGVVESKKVEIREKISNLSISEASKSALLSDLETSQATEVAAQVGVTITPSAHNTYLRVLTENGIIGITLFLGFILSVLWKSRKAFLKGANFEPYQAAILAAWIGFLANSMVIDTLHWRLFWYLPALLLASLELKRAKS